MWNKDYMIEIVVIFNVAPIFVFGAQTRIIVSTNKKFATVNTKS